jgi:hypothetical protein
VKELRPGAIARLKASMQRTSGVAFRSPSNPSQNSSAQPRQPNRLLDTTIRTWRAVMDYMSPPVSLLPTGQSNKTATMPSKPNPKPAERRILSSCINFGRKGVVLYQEDIAEQNEDRLLFPHLRLQHTKRVGKVRSVLSLQTVIGIHFVNVSYLQNPSLSQITRRQLLTF